VESELVVQYKTSCRLCYARGLEGSVIARGGSSCHRRSAHEDDETSWIVR